MEEHSKGLGRSSELPVPDPDIFLSYNRQDADRARQFAAAFAAEGFDVWWDVSLRSGQTYDEVTEEALHSAKAVVVLWSPRSVASRWVRAEATVADQNKTLLPVTIEPCRRPVKFELTQTAELSHWRGDVNDPAWQGFIADIRAFLGPQSDAPATQATSTPTAGARDGGYRLAAFLLVALVATGAWFALRPPPVAAHLMHVRLAGFQILSADLPATMSDAVGAEIIAAFNEDGVVSVSTASAPVSGTAPAYALGGTIQRNGDSIRVYVRLTNERSGVTLWSNTINQDATQVSRVPRRIAVDAGNVVRCGLFGASTYRTALPDPVFGDYLQFCQGHWDPNLGAGRKALIPAQRVVAAVPDFSWGWAAVAGGFWKVALGAEDNRLAEEARASGRQAADRAIALDGKNSEALYIKSQLVDRNDWIGRESLLKRAVAARRLDCGCEHHQYGDMLVDVGRVTDAVDQLRQANDLLALYVYTPLSLADALIAAGKPEEAKPYFDAAIELAPDSGFADGIAISKAIATGDIEALLDHKLPIPAELRAALLKGYRAMASRDAGAKARAVQALLALPARQQGAAVARLLADLGADHEAFQIAARLATTGEYPGPSVFWYRSMRGTLADPGFPAVAERLGLFKYWKTTHSKPDICNAQAPPPFCRMI